MNAIEWDERLTDPDDELNGEVLEDAILASAEEIPEPSVIRPGGAS